MKYRFTLLFLLILLVGSVYAADIVIDIGRDKFNFNGHEEDILFSEDAFLEPNINELNKYSENLKIDSSGNRGKIIVEEETGDIVIESPSGETYMKIPKGIRLSEDQGSLLFSGNIQETPLKIGEFLVDSKGDLEASFSDDGDVQTAKLERGDLKVGGEPLLGIKDAEVRVDRNGEINFAIFESPDGGDYDFDYKGRRYEFEVGKSGGRVLFDPHGQGVYGENTELIYEYFDGEMQIRHFFSGKEVTATFSEDGLVSIEIVNGAYEKRIFGVDQKFSSRGDFTVFLDGTEVRDFDGNAASIDDRNRKFNMKGAIKASNLKGSLGYEGFSTDAYSEFYFDGRDEDGIPYIDVQKGVVEIDNEKHLIRFNNGVAKLSILNGDRKFPTDFKFKVGNIDGFVNEKDNNYNLVLTIPGKDSIVVNTPLGSYSELSSKALIGEQLAFEKTSNELNSRLKSVREKISSGQFEGRELQALEQLEIINQYKLDLLEGKSLDDSIANLNKFFRKKLDPEIDITSRILLAEMRMAKAQGLTGEEARKNYEFARNSYRKNLDRLLGTPGTRGLIEEAKFKYSFDELDVELRRLRGLVDQNEAGLLNSFVRDSNKDSRALIQQDDFLRDYFPKTPETIRLAALAELSRNPTGEKLRRALRDLHFSEVNDGGPQSTQARINLELALIDNRLRQFRAEGGKLLQDTENIFGEDYLNFLKEYGIYAENFNSPITAIRHEFFPDRRDEIKKQHNYIIDEVGRRSVGLNNMRKLVGSGVDMQEYFQATNVERLQRVLDVNNFDGYVSAQQFRDYSDSLGLTFEASTIDSDTRKLFSAISSDRGDAIGRKYSEEFTRAVLSMDSIQSTVSNDPVAFNIAAHGSNIDLAYTGEIPLVDAFRLDRFGNAIEQTTGDYILKGVDFATVLAAPAGAGKIIAGGVKYARGQQVLNSIRAGLTTETLTAAYLGEGFTSSALGIAGDTAIALGAAYGLSEDSSQFIDMVTMFGAVNTAGRGVKSGLKSLGVFEDALGNKQALGIVDADLYNKMRVSSNYRSLGNGVLLGKNGERFARDVPTGLVEIDKFDVNSDLIQLAQSNTAGRPWDEDNLRRAVSTADPTHVRGKSADTYGDNMVPAILETEPRPGGFIDDSLKFANTRAKISDLQNDGVFRAIDHGIARVERLKNGDTANFGVTYTTAVKGEGRGELYDAITENIFEDPTIPINPFTKHSRGPPERYISDYDFSQPLDGTFASDPNYRISRVYTENIELPSGQKIQRQIFEVKPNGVFEAARGLDRREASYIIQPFRPEDKPAIIEHMSALYDRSLTGSIDERASAIAELKFYGYTTNVYNRGADGITTATSMVLERNAGISLPGGFTKQDYQAIARNRADYVAYETDNLLARYDPNQIPVVPTNTVGNLFDAQSQQISHAARNAAQNPNVPRQDVFVDPAGPPVGPVRTPENSHLATRGQIENAIGQKAGDFASQIHEPTGKDIGVLFRETMAEGVQDNIPKVRPGGFRDVAEDLADRRMFVEDFQGDPRKIGDRIEKGLANLNPDSQEFVSGQFLARRGEDRTGRLYEGIEREIGRSFQKADLSYAEASNLQFSMGLFNEEGQQHFIRTTKLNGEDVVQYAVKTEPIGGIYDDDIREGIFLTHFRKEDKPKIARHLNSLHDRIASSNSPVEQARLISEFEWWWFSSNPTTRGGAAIGDSMSMVYQQHVGIPIRNGFTNQDYVAIGSNLENYVEARTRQFIQGNRVPVEKPVETPVFVDQ